MEDKVVDFILDEFAKVSMGIYFNRVLVIIGVNVPLSLSLSLSLTLSFSLSHTHSLSHSLSHTQVKAEVLTQVKLINMTVEKVCVYGPVVCMYNINHICVVYYTGERGCRG